jgi:hypothetical protein
LKRKIEINIIFDGSEYLSGYPKKNTQTHPFEVHGIRAHARESYNLRKNNKNFRNIATEKG